MSCIQMAAVQHPAALTHFGPGPPTPTIYYWNTIQDICKEALCYSPNMACCWFATSYLCLWHINYHQTSVFYESGTLASYYFARSGEDVHYLTRETKHTLWSAMSIIRAPVSRGLACSCLWARKWKFLLNNIRLALCIEVVKMKRVFRPWPTLCLHVLNHREVDYGGCTIEERQAGWETDTCNLLFLCAHMLCTRHMHV